MFVGMRNRSFEGQMKASKLMRSGTIKTHTHTLTHTIKEKCIMYIFCGNKYKHA